MATKVSEALARPVRTGAQGGAGWAVTEFIDAFFWNMDERQYGILIVVLTTLIGYVQVLVENYFGKALLRNIPAADVKVVDDNPAAPGADH
jgi:hypothetical protein